MTLREQMARAIFDEDERMMAELEIQGARMKWPEYRDRYLRRVDAMLGVAAIVDHKLLDFARAGLPLESGTAARFWLAAVNAIKQGAA